MRDFSLRVPKSREGMNDIRPLKDVLSPTFLAVTQAIAEGKTNAAIARERGTTERVIKNYTHRIYNATGCATRLELANRYAFENLEEMRAAGAPASLPETWVFGGAA